jgi:hypothetical protein
LTLGFHAGTKQQIGMNLSVSTKHESDGSMKKKETITSHLFSEPNAR